MTLIPHSECSRTPPSWPLKPPLIGPARSATITPTCYLLPSTTSAAALRPVTAAQRWSTDEQQPPLWRSQSAVTASLSLEADDDLILGFCHL